MSQLVLILAPQDLLRQVLETTASLLARAGKTVRAAAASDELVSVPTDEATDVVLWGLCEADLPQVTAVPDGGLSAIAVLADMGMPPAQESSLLGTTAPMVLRREVASVAALAPPPALATRGPRAAAKPAPRVALTIGLDGPTQAGDWGQLTEGGMRWLVRAVADDESLKKRKTEESHIHLQRLMPVPALTGWSEDHQVQTHTMVSALTALALGHLLGCSLAPMLHGLRDAREVREARVTHEASVGGGAA